MRDVLDEHEVIRTVVYRISGPTDVEPNQTRLPEPLALDTSTLRANQARVHVVAATDDLRSLVDALSAAALESSESVHQDDGSSVFLCTAGRVLTSEDPLLASA